MALDYKIFVVIVTYNGARWIDKNITSVLSSSCPLNIIAIDNNSTDDSVALLKKYPEVEVIQSSENLGFGKANNIGIKKALQSGADYVFLLNQDTWVFKDTIEKLVSKMHENPRIGILSPLHYIADSKTLDAGFETYYNRFLEKCNRKKIVHIPFVNAAAWMVSRRCFEKTGLFQPMFSHYGEDRDYCNRVLYHNFKIAIDEETAICHDRHIKRNFTKDTIQSKYKMLATALNINYSGFKAYSLALREVFGLPKYFLKFYGIRKAAVLLFKLSGYYLKLLVSVKTIITERNKAKL